MMIPLCNFVAFKCRVLILFVAWNSELGFQYHHAEGGAATLLLWLPKDESSKVPLFATHHLGVGGLVLNADTESEHFNKVLVVKEHGTNMKWKLPGGLADLGEDIGQAVEREVEEETNIQSKFHSVLTIRHQHQAQFGRSDIYLICLSIATTDKITVDREIQDAMWMNPATLKEKCQFPTVVTAVDLLESGEIYNMGLVGRKYTPEYRKNKPPYTLFSPDIYNVISSLK